MPETDLRQPAATAEPRTFLGAPKLPARYAGIVMPFILSVLMTFVVSLVSTLMTLGVVPHFLQVWALAWATSWVVAFPTLLTVLPLVRRMTAALVRSP